MFHVEQIDVNGYGIGSYVYIKIYLVFCLLPIIGRARGRRMTYGKRKLLVKDKYILEGKTPVSCNDLMEWARQYEKTDRHVKRETVNGYDISTVFLGLNHNFGNGEPLLFETMIFNSAGCESHDYYQDRCSTWEEAEAMHEKAKAMVLAEESA